MKPPITRIAIATLIGGALIGIASYRTNQQQRLPSLQSIERPSGRANDNGQLNHLAEPSPTSAVTDPAYKSILDAERQLRGLVQVDPTTGKSSTVRLTAKETARLLKSLLASLETMDAHMAALAIKRFLTTGKDAATGLPFGVAPGGGLSSASSFRIFLMDALGRIDPAEARKQAEDVFSTSMLADEWAVALRNVVWAVRDPLEPALNARVKQLLENTAWRRAPTVGFLNAFDVAAYARGAESTKGLVDILSSPFDQGAVRGAAYLALDRKVALGETAVFRVLETRPDAMSDNAARRAELYARLQFEKPEQRPFLDAYLSRISANPAEVGAFLSYFPCYDVHGAHGLVTSPVFPKINDVKQSDVAALAQVQAWLNDPRFAGAKNELLQARTRLEKFIASAQTGELQDKQRNSPQTR